MRKVFLLALLLLLSNLGQAQTTGPGFIIYVGSAPSGTCSAGAYLEQVIGLGTVYTCQSGTWTQISGGGGGSGTVTSVSGLSPLFTVANATTTPTFSLSTFAAHKFYGNNTGSTATPGAQSVTEDDVTSLTSDLALKAPLASPTFTGVPAAPTAAQGTNTTQLATMAALQTAIQGVNPAVAVQAATIAVLPNSPTYSNGASGIGATLTAGSAAALVVDGYTPILNDRILVKTQASSFQNGVYFLSTLGTGIIPYVLTRALDFDMPSDMNNTGAIPVLNGTVNAVTQWVISSTVTTVGTDAVTFTQFSANPQPESHTASTSAALNFTTCLTNSSFHVFEVSIYGYVPATDNTDAKLQFSTDGGSTYDTTSGHYMWSNNYSEMEAASNGKNQSGSDVAILIVGGIPLLNTATPALVARFRIYDPASAANRKYVVGDATAVLTATGNHYLANFAGNFTQTTAVNAFRLIQSSGNITAGTATCNGVTP